ncbi:hypothetical protein RN346_03760 [Halomonas sp. PAMB 3232]|uniref:hypothetical protein n=1 Tax=Halomonas sp. PAMB 3232 TaxID=3075221 RepID=UPI00289A11BB|nr:hypothetical protein [Halomonas sp. PAMB 3232]WNL39683.1 hypothetical protein RN346_03760 [Halomonas sp. PAMB 3232]
MDAFYTMNQQPLITLLSAWGGGAFVWLAYALSVWNKRPRAMSRSPGFAANWRRGDIYLTLAGPILLVMATLLAVTVDIKPGDWFRALFAGVFLAGMAPLGIFHFANHAAMVESAQVTSDTTRLPVNRNGRLNRAAPYMAAISATLFSISCFYLFPQMSLAWSLLAGAVWALLALMRRALPACPEWLAGIGAIVGINAGLVLSDLAYKEHLAVESNTTSTMEFLLFVQQASVALLSFSLLLLATHRFIRG